MKMGQAGGDQPNWRKHLVIKDQDYQQKIF
jgi:hypothetical protein